jgi:NADH dehydrogenase (ubiquinone) 1 alpha subcomplex subunit 13
LREEVVSMEGVVLTKRSELAREKMWARIHLIPALQAEEDRDQVRRYLADKAREKELLGSETRVYNSDRYVTDAARPDEQANSWI